MSALIQPPSTGDVVKYELIPNFTRETVALLAGTDYPAGSVLGRVTASGKWKLATASGSDGAQNAAGVLLYPVDARLIDAIGIVLARGPAIVSRAGLAYDASVSDAARITAKLGQLTALGIVPRDAA